MKKTVLDAQDVKSLAPWFKNETIINALLRWLNVERVNKLYGTNISVDFNSAWKENEEEKDLIKDKMESEAAGDSAKKIEEEIKTDSIESEKEEEDNDNSEA